MCMAALPSAFKGSLEVSILFSVLFSKRYSSKADFLLFCPLSGTESIILGSGGLWKRKLGLYL